MSEHSRSEQRRLALAEAVAARWGDRSLSYAVVHGLERYPVCIGRDLDVAIARESIARAVETAIACGRDHGFGTALFRWSHWGLYQLALLDPEESVALEGGSPPGGLAGSLPSLQRRWARSHPVAAVRSLRDAVAGRDRRRFLNPAACVFVATPEPEAVLDAARELAPEARRMFVDVRPRAMPTSRLRRTAAEVGVWRAPPVSEFVVTVVVGREDPAGLGLHRVLPTTVLRPTG